MRRIRHELPHEHNRSFDRVGGFPHEQKATGRYQDQRRECHAGKGRDEISVPVLQLHAVGDGDSHELLARRQLETQGVEPESLVSRCLMLNSDLTCLASLPRRPADPVADLCRFDRISLEIQQIENPVRDVELVDGVDDAAVRARCLHLSDPRRPREVVRCAREGIVELARELMADHDEEPGAKQQDDQTECRDVPDRETQSEAYQPLDAGA